MNKYYAQGFVIEFNVRSEDGREFPSAMMTSDQFGSELFTDLTTGYHDVKSGSVLIEHGLEGSHDGIPVRYDQALVVISRRRPKYNHQVDVAFSIDTEHADLNDVPVADLVKAMKERADAILKDAGGREAFGLLETCQS